MLQQHIPAPQRASLRARAGSCTVRLP